MLGEVPHGNLVLHLPSQSCLTPPRSVVVALPERMYAPKIAVPLNSSSSSSDQNIGVPKVFGSDSKMFQASTPAPFSILFLFLTPELNAPRYPAHFEPPPRLSSHIMHNIRPTHPLSRLSCDHAAAPRSAGSVQVRVESVRPRGRVKSVVSFWSFD